MLRVQIAFQIFCILIKKIVHPIKACLPSSKFVFYHIFKIARDGRSKSCIDCVAFLACSIIGKCDVFHVFSSVIWVHTLRASARELKSQSMKTWVLPRKHKHLWFSVFLKCCCGEWVLAKVAFSLEYFSMTI